MQIYSLHKQILYVKTYPSQPLIVFFQNSHIVILISVHDQRAYRKPKVAAFIVVLSLNSFANSFIFFKQFTFWFCGAAMQNRYPIMHNSISLLCYVSRHEIWYSVHICERENRDTWYITCILCVYIHRIINDSSNFYSVFVLSLTISLNSI